MRGFYRSTGALVALLATTAIGSQAKAQIAPPGPVRDAIDTNGVDLFSGRMMIQAPGLTIGGADQGMSYARVFRQTTWTDDLIATLDPGITSTISQGLRSDSFTLSGGVYTSTEGNGATLALSGLIYTYTAADGTVIHFDKSYAVGFPASNQTGAQVADITLPSGTKYTFNYTTATYCIGVLSPQGCTQEASSSRLMSVQSSFGYKVAFTHARAAPGLKGQLVDEWLTVTGASVTNLAGATGTPVASNSYAVTATTQTVTDALGRVYQYTKSGNDLTGIRLPGSAADNVTIGYTSGRVTSVTTAAGTTSYAASDAAGVRTVTVTDPLTHATTYKFNIASKRIAEVTNANGKTTTMQYDPNGRLTRTTMPEGNYVQLTYDARGNVTERRAVSKTPGTPADIVTTASFPATCTNPKTCNQPIWTKDARNNQTDYTYDTGHGGVLTVTAPMVGAVRPQTRYSYTSLQAYYRNSGGSIVASGIPVLRLTGVSACQTTASCTGAADEVKSTVNYGPQVTGTGNNLLPVSTSTGAGNGSLTATTAYGYDEIGNLTTVDGPLSGTADTTRNIYNAARERVGTISPDPDGAGALKNRAQRITYGTNALVTKIENGTTNGQTDPAWAAFAPAEAIDIAYDSVRRPVTRTLSSGGTAYALTQTSYLADNRVDCVATRMNSAIYGSLPASACALGSQGSYGPDRISKSIYDNAGQVTQQQVAVGVIGDEATEATFTFTNNGRLKTLKDAENNLTTYIYDGHDRLLQTQYPNAPKGSGTSNPNDNEVLIYDASSNVTSRQLRGTPVTSIGFTYDALNRPTQKDLPGSEPDVTYTYDNLGRLTSATFASGGQGIANSFDALGRLSSTTTDVGGTARTLSYLYDLAGRRTRMNWWDGTYVDYDRLVTGELSKVRWNGAASGLGVLASYGYDDLGRRNSLTRGNGTVTSYGYDAVSRLSSMTEDLAGVANDLTQSFSYNPAFQITSVTRSNDNLRLDGPWQRLNHRHRQRPQPADQRWRQLHRP